MRQPRAQAGGDALLTSECISAVQISFNTSSSAVHIAAQGISSSRAVRTRRMPASPANAGRVCARRQGPRRRTLLVDDGGVVELGQGPFYRASELREDHVAQLYLNSTPLAPS
jgi:hypothetical protein